ncbi:UNVERIFIED_CONTAM: hypothetical protein H355_001921 [Colinus virginianus]|nr:hypothetical protein H355_001921 [Colinus virginianus]
MEEESPEWKKCGTEEVYCMFVCIACLSDKLHLSKYSRAGKKSPQMTHSESETPEGLLQKRKQRKAPEAMQGKHIWSKHPIVLSMLEDSSCTRAGRSRALFSLTICHDMRTNTVQSATYSYSSVLHSIPTLSSGNGTAKPGKPRGTGTTCREMQRGSTEVHPPSGEKGNWWWAGHERSSAFILLPELAGVILVAHLPAQLYILQTENSPLQPLKLETPAGQEQQEGRGEQKQIHSLLVEMILQGCDPSQKAERETSPEGHTPSKSRGEEGSVHPTEKW